LFLVQELAKTVGVTRRVYRGEGNRVCFERVEQNTATEKRKITALGGDFSY